MRRSADLFAVLLAAGLVMGCMPEKSAPPAPEPRTIVIERLETRQHNGPAIRKKKKEPGLGNAMPTATRRPGTGP